MGVRARAAPRPRRLMPCTRRVFAGRPRLSGARKAGASRRADVLRLAAGGVAFMRVQPARACHGWHIRPSGLTRSPKA
ncbi:hypothetical protein FAIPA1_200005 [Frankia sp. AiPs1]